MSSKTLDKLLANITPHKHKHNPLLLVGVVAAVVAVAGVAVYFVFFANKSADQKTGFSDVRIYGIQNTQFANQWSIYTSSSIYARKASQTSSENWTVTTVATNGTTLNDQGANTNVWVMAPMYLAAADNALYQLPWFLMPDLKQGAGTEVKYGTMSTKSQGGGGHTAYGMIVNGLNPLVAYAQIENLTPQNWNLSSNSSYVQGNLPWWLGVKDTEEDNWVHDLTHNWMYWDWNNADQARQVSQLSTANSLLFTAVCASTTNFGQALLQVESCSHYFAQLPISNIGQDWTQVTPLTAEFPEHFVVTYKDHVYYILYASGSMVRITTAQVTIFAAWRTLAWPSSTQVTAVAGFETSFFVAAGQEVFTTDGTKALTKLADKSALTNVAKGTDKVKTSKLTVMHVASHPEGRSLYAILDTAGLLVRLPLADPKEWKLVATNAFFDSLAFLPV